MRRSTARRTMRRATALRATRRRTALRATLRRTAFRATLRRTALRATLRRTAFRATLRRTALRATLRRTALRTALLALRRRRAITSTPLRRPRPPQRSSRGDGSSLGSSRSAYRQPARGASPRSAATPWLHSTSGSAMGELRVRRSIFFVRRWLIDCKRKTSFDERTSAFVTRTRCASTCTFVTPTTSPCTRVRVCIRCVHHARVARARDTKSTANWRRSRVLLASADLRVGRVDATRRRRAGSIPMEAAAP